MKKILSYLLFLLLLFIIHLLPTSALEIKTCERSIEDLHVNPELKNDNNVDDILETPCVSSEEKVYDFADLLTDQEELEIQEAIFDFIEISNYDLGVVTINDNPKDSAQSYADDFYDYNYFGFNETRDGLLILIDMENREVYISTTGYAIKMYDDWRIDEIIDAGYYYLKNNDFKMALSEMIKSTSYYFQEDFPSSNENLLIDEAGKPYYVKYIPYPLIIIFSLIITTVVSLICYFKTRLKIKVISTVSYLKEKKLTLEKDVLINTIVTHTPRYESNSGGGSSSGGGSTFHSSSSGSFHGGGGRHF